MSSQPSKTQVSNNSSENNNNNNDDKKKFSPYTFIVLYTLPLYIEERISF